MLHTIDRERILTAAEIRLVLSELYRKARRSKIGRRRLVLFRLATCCGLRATEICQLKLGDVRFGVRPSLRVKAKLKRGKMRTVPLNWDGGTLSDLREWCQIRVEEGALESDYLLVSGNGGPLNRHGCRQAFRIACRKLGREVTIHDGRHTFISHALHQQKSISAVQAAVGHRSLASTAIYAHLIDDDDGRIGQLFGAGEAEAGD